MMLVVNYEILYITIVYTKTNPTFFIINYSLSISCLVCSVRFSFQLTEFHDFFLKIQLRFTDRTVPILSQTNISQSFLIRIRIVVILSMKHDYRISILLNCSRFSQIGKLWFFIDSFLDFTGKLRQCHDRDFQFSRKLFQSS